MIRARRQLYRTIVLVLTSLIISLQSTAIINAWSPSHLRLETRRAGTPLHLSFNSNDDENRDQRFIGAMLSRSLVAVGFAASLFLFSQETSAMPVGKQYYDIMASDSREERIAANEALLDYAVGTINTQFYDNTGGNNFTPSDFYRQWRSFRKVAVGEAPVGSTALNIPKGYSIDTREGAVESFKWLVSSLGDPFSKYLTREELRQELSQEGQDGFLGVGAIVETPQPPRGNVAQAATSRWNPSQQRVKKFLSTSKVVNLPVITAVEPHSPAERAGLVVGDRIVAVGSKSFLGRTQSQVHKTLSKKYNAASYFGHADLTIAKPVYAFKDDARTNVVIGYRPSRVHLPTIATDTTPNYSQFNIGGGDSIVHYQLLTSSTGSIFDHLYSQDVLPADYKVGYIRLTRFSKTATRGFLEAIRALEDAGAKSYILDLRNNYGGVIQEALLTASTLIRDPHAVLCYTMNARGAFTPHEVEEYVVDKRYPGYLLSTESQSVTLEQLRKERPRMFQPDGQVDWDPPSSYASIHEQITKRGMHRISYYNEKKDSDPVLKHQLKAQKKLVLLINEGTASSAEVFSATLHDNLRAVALVGTRTYGKGLIQHTFSTPDGGGLRLTIAEYLTPALKHVTDVFDARYDRETGQFLGGGLTPDIYCESKQGIPGNVGADLCVRIALDALEEASINGDENDDPPRPFAGESSQMMVKGFPWGWKPGNVR